MSLPKNQKFALGILMVFIVTIFLAGPILLKADQQAATEKLNQAVTGTGIFGGLIIESTLKTVNSLLLIMLSVVGAILVFMGKILGIVLQITLDPRLYTDGIVGTGFKITLQIADMFFLLIMVIIGIATILQYEGYTLKKLLPTVILIALLINFALPISQFVVGFADDTAIFFFNQAFKGSMSRIGDLLINQIDPAAFVVDNKTAKESFCPGVLGTITLGSFFGAIGVGVALGCRAVSTATGIVSGNAILQQGALASSIVMALIIFLITLVYLIVGVFLFLLRTAMLWSLIILAPLAWLSMVLPMTAHYNTAWWKKFFTWAFFPFLYALFLYISLKITTSEMFQAVTTDYIKQIDLSSLNASFVTFGVLTLGPMLGAITIFILFFGGMIMSLKMAGGAGEAVINGAERAKDWAVGATGKALKQKVGAPVLGKAGEKMARIPGLRMASRGMLAKAGKWRGEQITDYEVATKNIAGLQTQSQKDAYVNSFTIDKSKQAGIVTSLAKARDSKTVENALAKNPELESIIKEKADKQSLTAVAKITLKPEFLVDENTDLKQATKKMIGSLSQEDITKIDTNKFKALNQRTNGVAAKEIARKINENTASEIMRSREDLWDEIVVSIENDAIKENATKPTGQQKNLLKPDDYKKYVNEYKSNIFQNKTFKLIDNSPAESKKQEVQEVKVIIPSTSIPEKTPEETKSFQEQQSQFMAERKAAEEKKRAGGQK